MAVVHVPQNEAAPMIRQLLKAAEELGLPASVVATSSDGVFGFSLVVPDEVFAKAQTVGADGDVVPVVVEVSKEDFDKLATSGKTPVLEVTEEPAVKPKNKGGRPRKVVAEPVVEEE